MPDYSKGKIYIIKSDETDKVYIGSTCSTLSQRFSCHKSDYKHKIVNPDERGKSFSSYLQIVKYSDARIELIEDFPCETRRELLNREGELCRTTPNCVNITINGRTKKQWDEDNKEHCREYRKKFCEENKELIVERYKAWYNSEKGKAYLQKRNDKLRGVTVECPVCKKQYSKSSISTHIKAHNI